jgi:hypothetical protein
MIVLGAGMHKSSHTIAAVDAATGQVLGEKTIAVGARGFGALVVWARGLTGERAWALEDCRHVSGGLERIDALAVARAALAEAVETLPTAVLAGPRLDVRSLVDHRERLVRQRCAVNNTLQWNLHDLWPELALPGGALFSRKCSTRIGRRLARAEQTMRARIARDELRRMLELTQAITALEADISELVARSRAVAHTVLLRRLRLWCGRVNVGERDRLLDAHPWTDVQPPDEVLEVPTMLSVQERALLYVLARDYADPSQGAIVDAGCFLGGSTVALLAGLRDRSTAWTGPPVVSYDLFRVEAYSYDKYFGAHFDKQVGDSFRDLYDVHVSGFGVPHVTHEGDLARIGWNGGPIQILFLDVLKSWALADAVQRAFWPHVIPGHTLIVHQDYGWGGAPWIQLGVEVIWDSLRLIDSMPHGTHVFLIERPIPANLRALDLRRIPLDRQLGLLRRARARWPARTAAMIDLATVALLAQHGDVHQARALAAAARAASDDPAVRRCADDVERRTGITRARSGRRSPASQV